MRFGIHLILLQTMAIVSPQAIAERPASPQTWQAQMQHAVSDPRQLLQLLGLEAFEHLLSDGATQLFRLRVPLAYVSRMQHGDIDDPLLRQVLPIHAEMEHAAGFSDDPVADLDHLKVPGLIHKYHGRVLLITTGGCAINCRYCFRRTFPYSDNSISKQHLQQCLNYIASDSSISEVIFSGGDPLLLANRKLQQLAAEVLSIPHVTQLRIHTRLPVVLPDRIDQAFCAWLQQLPQPAVNVLHCNHAREIDQHLNAACKRLRATGVTLLNQAVLLRGVNDNTNAQVDLARALLHSGVLPYYLHQLDKVSGASHFLVDDESARNIHAGMQAQLPGYLLPRLVRDEPGKTAKSAL
jgi:EF-P beta-lysylation protein EpmB